MSFTGPQSNGTFDEKLEDNFSRMSPATSRQLTVDTLEEYWEIGKAFASRRSIRQWRFLTVAAATLTLLVTALLLSQPHARGNFLPSSAALFGSAGDAAVDLASAPENAFLSFLSAPPPSGDEDDSDRDDDTDVYFTGIRMLAYSLLHDPATSTRKGYPFLVLTTQYVKQSKIDRLKLDGATIINVEKIESPWLNSTVTRWHGVLSKLHMFELTQFKRLAFFDSDIVVVRNMDGIFEDEAVKTQQNLRKPELAKFDDGPEPDEYVMASITGQGSFDHPYPQRKGYYLNAGCVVFQPSVALYNLYMNIVTNGTDRFDPRYPEQNLWNYVHRYDGNMPWKNLEGDWNTNWPTFKDYTDGYASLHGKWWDTRHDDKLRDIFLRIKWKMEGYYERMDVEAERVNYTLAQTPKTYAQLTGGYYQRRDLA